MERIKGGLEEGWMDGHHSSNTVIKPPALSGVPLTEAVLTGPATNESDATPKLAVAALVAKDTL